MRIVINGKEETMSSMTLEDLLNELGHEAESVATAVNLEFVAIGKRPRYELGDGDLIDIIAPMSGG